MKPTLDLPTTLDRVKRSALSRFWTHSERDDLAQEACLKAWQLWEDGDKGDGYILKFSVLHAYRYMTTVPYTGSENGKTRAGTTEAGDQSRERIRQAQAEYRTETGQEATKEELSRRVGLPPSSIRYHLRKTPVRSGPIEFQELTPEDNERIGCEGFESGVVDGIAVREATARLTDRQRRILYGIYWEDQPQAAVSRALGLSGAGVHKHHRNALTALAETL